MVNKLSWFILMTAIARMQTQLEDIIRIVDHHLGMMYKIVFAVLVIVGGECRLEELPSMVSGML